MKSKLIAIVGPDGTGKSTVQDKLVKHLSQHTSVKKYHKGFGILENISFKTGLVSANDKLNPRIKNNSESITIKKTNRFFARIFIVIYLLEYFFGRLLLFIQIDIMKNTIVFDRYFFDLYSYPFTRSILKDNLWCIYFVRKPDITVLLKGDSESIYLRKKEITEAEISLQINYLESVIPKLVNKFIIIDTTKNSIDEVANIILSKL